MSSSLLLWAAAAVLVAWAVGAYNRLVRLRSEVNMAFSAVEAELLPLARLVDDMLAAADADSDVDVDADPGAAGDDRAAPSPEFLAPIREASAQLSAALAAARQRPLDRKRIARLRRAGDTWSRAWDRAEREDAHDLAGPQLPETVSTERLRRLKQSEVIGGQFNEAVDRYNQAIGQFPAVILALLFGFRSGRRL